MAVEADKLIWMYRRLVSIRAFEERAIELFKAGELPGFLHSQIGQEAVPVGVCAALRDDDYITSTHRGHGDVIAKGARLDRMMAELYGKEPGYCRGKGGSMHIADFKLGIMGANGIVGGSIPIATGVGVSIQMQGTDQVVVCFFGDGGANQGSFHEALNLASTWNLPVVYICQNNQYAESTPQMTHQKIKDIAVRAKAYEMPGTAVDGNDVVAVYETAQGAVDRARAGEGPTLIEAKTYRILGHYVGDPGVYRPEGEVEYWKTRDPIEIHRARLLDQDILTIEEIQATEDEARTAVEEAVAFARQSPDPGLEEALEDVYSGWTWEGKRL
ncbi:MAG: thiamine pyrophosphate-dependent dehydrogenase E1 component subunit alpha [Anaerolineae bacterium]